MAERQVARLLRPWLLSSTALSSRRPLLSTCCLGVTSSNRPIIPQTRHVSTSTPLLNKHVRRPPQNSSRARKEGHLPINIDNHSILVPLTFVAPPISRYPRDSPLKFLRFAYLVWKTRAMNYGAQLLHKLYSKPSFLSKPLYQMKKGALIPAARALHLQMSEAIAAGDKDTLRTICTQELYERLAGTIDARPRGMRTEWELVKYEGRLAGYPRINDDRIAMMPITATENRTIRQVVVSIASVQRMARYDDTQGGVKVPGSEKVRKMLEHIVLTSYVNDKTWEHGRWRIWGTLPESTMEAYQAETDTFHAMAAQQDLK